MTQWRIAPDHSDLINVLIYIGIIVAIILLAGFAVRVYKHNTTPEARQYNKLLDSMNPR